MRDFDVIDFEAKVFHLADESVVVVRGELDLATVDQLSLAIDEALAVSQRVVLNLTDMTFGGSAALSLFVATKKRLDAVNGSLVLRSPPQGVLRAMEITGLDRDLTIEGGAHDYEDT